MDDDSFMNEYNRESLLMYPVAGKWGMDLERWVQERSNGAPKGKRIPAGGSFPPIVAGTPYIEPDRIGRGSC